MELRRQLNPFDLFLITWLASYRLTRMFTKDSLFSRQRGWWYKRFPPDAARARMYNKNVSRWGQLINCAWCIGFHISGLVVLAVQEFQSMPLPVIWWFAISSAVGLTAKNLD